MPFNESPFSWLPRPDAVVKATVVLLAGACASAVLRHASAALRHLVWTLALCGALVLPVVSLSLPKWQLPILTISETSLRDPEPVAAPLATATTPLNVDAP